MVTHPHLLRLHHQHLLHGRMGPARRDCGGREMLLPAGCLLLLLLLLQPAVAKVCNDRTKHGQDNSWFARDGENLPIMVLMPMNESALMSSISQGIEPAVQLAIQHIRESRKYSFSLITKIYDTEVMRERKEKREREKKRNGDICDDCRVSGACGGDKSVASLVEKGDAPFTRGALAKTLNVHAPRASALCACACERSQLLVSVRSLRKSHLLSVTLLLQPLLLPKPAPLVDPPPRSSSSSRLLMLLSVARLLPPLRFL